MIRFFDKVDKTESCWNWTGHITNAGYGQFLFDGKTQKAHMVSYILEYGKIPNSLVIDHLCKNKKCVNPKHLEAVSQKENVNRGLAGKINNAQASKRVCPSGHKYNRINKHWHRLCRKCRSDQTIKSRKLKSGLA